jgi:hypothetical protein
VLLCKYTEHVTKYNAVLRYFNPLIVGHLVVFLKEILQLFIKIKNYKYSDIFRIKLNPV